MRGQDVVQGSMFSYVDIEQRIPASHPLRKVKIVVDGILRSMSGEFDRRYSWTGRPSTPPEHLLRALLLQVLYTIRSERQLMEQLDYNLLFRWFVGLGVDDAVWERTVFCANRDRLLEQTLLRQFFDRVLGIADWAGLVSGEHFSDDGTTTDQDARLYKKAEYAIPDAAEKMAVRTLMPGAMLGADKGYDANPVRHEGTGRGSRTGCARKSAASLHHSGVQRVRNRQRD